MAEGGRTPPRSPRNQWMLSPTSSQGSPGSPGLALSPRIPDLHRPQLQPHPKDSWTWADLLAQTRGAYQLFKNKNNVRIGSDDKYMAKMDEYERILKNSDDKEEKERIRLKLRHLSDFIDQITHLDEEGSPGPTGSNDYSTSSGSSNSSDEMDEKKYKKYMERRNLGERPTPRVQLYQKILDSIEKVQMGHPSQDELLRVMLHHWDELVEQGADIPGAFYWYHKLGRLSELLMKPNLDPKIKRLAYEDLLDFSEFMAVQIHRDNSNFVRMGLHEESLRRRQPTPPRTRQAANILRESMLGGRQRAAEHDIDKMFDQLPDSPTTILNRWVSSPSRFQPADYAVHNPPVPQNTPQKPEAFRHREQMGRLAFREGPTGWPNQGFWDWGGHRATDVEWEGSDQSSTTTPSSLRGQSPEELPPADIFEKDYHQLYQEGIQHLNYIKRNVTAEPRHIAELEDCLECTYKALFETPHRQDTEVSRMLHMTRLRGLIDGIRTLVEPSPKGPNFYSPITPPAPSPGVSPYGEQAASSMTEEEIQNVSDMIERRIPVFDSSPEPFGLGLPVLANPGNRQDPTNLGRSSPSPQPQQPPQPPQRSRSPSPNIRRRLF